MTKLNALSKQSESSGAVQRIRSSLLQQCLAAAEWRPGCCYTLSAPTGAGKTLAMLAFALKHTLAHPEHQFRRIVMVIPYLSIIDQTANVYRELFESQFDEQDPEYVLEDHSLARLRDDAGNEDQMTSTGRSQDDAAGRRRLLAENWDAPLVLTTSVQALESLMADRPTDCRKLHRLARSVILFDEVQTLPPPLAIATLSTLARLSERYGATVVFSTATQPAFDVLDEIGAVRELGGVNWKPREMVQDAKEMFEHSAARTRIHWHLDEPTPWDDLVEELAEPDNAQVLCIVNLKRHARDLVRTLRQRLEVQGGDAEVFHLSTSMCPRHRERLMAEVTGRLDMDQPCRLISTQCIEAGMDVDFPSVYRAMAPLEALAQAAGRCNRHGRRTQPGDVVIFVPEEEAYPPGGYERAASATRIFLKKLQAQGISLEETNILSDPAHLRDYYRGFYTMTDLSSEADKRVRELHEAIRDQNFEEVAQRYRLIEQDAINVVVPDEPTTFASLHDELQAWGRAPMPPTTVRRWIARARPMAVGMPRPKPDDAAWRVLQPVHFGYGEADERRADWFLLLETEPGRYYDRDLLGLIELESDWVV